MTGMDLSPEAVAQHLAEAEIAHTLSSPLYTDMSGVSTRVGWHRRNDTLMRSLSARVAEMERERDAAKAEATRRTREVELTFAVQKRLTAERDAARAEVARLREALRQIEADCEADYPPSHGAIKYAARAALAKEIEQ